MKKIQKALLLGLILFSFMFVGYFVKYHTKINYEDVNVNDVPNECMDHKENENLLIIINNYNYFKEYFFRSELAPEYKNEYDLIRAFADRSCSIIDTKIDVYSYQLCDIYVSGDYDRLDNFEFEDGETKKDTIAFYKLINTGETGSGSEKQKQSISSIINYEYNKNNINFKLTENTPYARADLYTFLIENGKEAFLIKLEEELVNECKKL